MKDFFQEHKYAVTVLLTALFPTFSCTCRQAYQLLKNILYFAIYHLFHLCVQTTLNNKVNNVKLFSRDFFLVRNRTKLFASWYLGLFATCSTTAPMSHMKEKYMFLPRIEKEIPNLCLFLSIQVLTMF